VIALKIIVQVSPGVARALHHRSPSTAESEDVKGIVAKYGLVLEAMHRHTDDPNLQSFFTVEIGDRAAAELVMNQLLRLEAVEAAYVKPPDEPP
jgi:hypothetical protein